MKKNYFIIIFIFVSLLSFFLLDGFNIRTKLLTALNIPTSSTRTENYDKLKVDVFKITERLTGTEPFNTGSVSNTNGVDVSPEDNYIRTNDTINYTLEVRILGTSDYEDKSGGILKVKGTLPNQGSPILMVFEEQAWMKNTVISADKTEIYAEYHFDPNQTPIGNQSITFTVKTLGYKKTITDAMKPTFEVWMEGNKPDNPSSSISSKTVRDTQPIIISGHQSLDIFLYGPSYTFVDNYEGTSGLFHAIIYGLALQQDVANFPDLRGVEFPYGKISFQYEVEYKYNDLSTSSGYQTITSSTPGANGILNGTKLIDTGYNCGDANFYPSNSGNLHSCGLTRGTPGNPKISVQGSGDYNVNFTGNKINVSIENYVLNNIFPTRNGWDTADISRRTGYFSALATQFYAPKFTPQNHSYDYTMVYTLKSASYKDINNNTYNLTYNNAPVNDAVTSNNSYSFGFSTRVAGSFGHTMQPLIWEHPSTHMRRAIYDDQDFTVESYQTITRDYPGGTDHFIAWDPNKMTVTAFSPDNYIYIRSNSNIYGFDALDLSTIYTKFGVYKANRYNGPPTPEARNKAYVEDFDWYDTYEAATATGVVSALYMRYTGNVNKGNAVVTRYRFKAHVNSSDVGNTTYLTSKGRAFSSLSDYTNRNGVLIANTYEDSMHSATYFTPTIYNSNGEVVTYETNSDLGETYLMIGYMTSVDTSVNDVDSNNRPKTIYDVQDGVVNVKVTPFVSNGKDTAIDDKYVDGVKVKTTLPKGLTYKNGSANKTPDSVIYDNDTGITTITWTYNHFQINHDAPDYKNLSFQAVLSLDLLNNQQLGIKSVISAPGDNRDEASFRTSEYGITIVNLAGSKGIKFLDPGVIDINGSFKVETKIGNTSSSNLINIQTVEVLPKNDVNVYRSKFSGSYTLKVLSLAPGEKMYYTTNSISDAGIYKDSSGIYVTTGVNYQTDSRWIEVGVGGTIPANATAVGSTIPLIASKTDVSHEVQVYTNGNYAKDYYAFVASFTSDNLETSVRTNMVVCYVRDYIIKGMVFKDKQNNNVYNASSDDKLANIPVKLYNENGVLIKTTTTDSNGNYIFEYLTKQKYYVKFEIDGTGHIYEVVSPRVSDPPVSSVCNSNYQTPLINFVGNEREVVVDNQNLGIKEKFRVITRVDGEGGVIVGDEYVYQGTDSTPNYIVATANDGYYIKKITINGQEITITNKHRNVVDYFRSIQENKTVVVTFEPNKLLVDKVDEDGAKLAGATFELYKNNVKTHSCVSTVSGCLMEKIVPGSYILKEVGVPAGFALQTTTYTVSVDSNGYISVNSVVPDVEVTARIGNKLNKLLINKVDENDEPLAGATLGLYQGDVKKYECTSTTSGCLMKGIHPGTYTLKETAVPPGYALQLTTYSVVVGIDGWISVNSETPVGEKTFKYRNKPNKLTINKVEEGDIPLKNAILGLFQGDEEKYRCTSDSNGKCIITKIYPGSYTLKEIDNPDGYILIRDTQDVYVSVDGWISVEGREKEAEPSTKVVNIPTKIELYLREGIAANHITGDEVKLQIEGPHGYNNVITLTDAKGYLLTHLKRGDYTIRQLGTDPNYINSIDEMTFNIRRDGRVNTNGHLQDVYTYINYEKPKVKITKRNSRTNEIIQGATLELKNLTTGDTKDISVGLQVLTLDTGHYELREKNKLDGYLYSNEVVDIKVLNNGELYINDTFQNSGVDYKFYNTPLPKLKIRKIDSLSGEEINGSVLKLKNLSNNHIDEINVGYKEITLDVGEYLLSEKKSPNGYILSNEVIPIKVDENGDLYVNSEKRDSGYLLRFINKKQPSIILTKKDSETGDIIDGASFRIKNINLNTYEDITIGSTSITLDDGEYEISELRPSNGYLIDTRKVNVSVDQGVLKVDGVVREDSYEIVYQNTKNTLRIRKVDEDKNIVPLAVIGIYSGELEIMRFTTTSEDTIIRGLKRGIYTIKEISSPENYVKSEDTYEINVGVDEISPSIIEITNILMPKITVEKIDSDTNEKVIGANMVILNENDEKVCFFKTKEDNYQVHLPYGKYVLKEESAPKGYIKSDERVEFTLDRNSDKNIKLVFKNDPTYNFIINKIGLDGKGIDGAIFELKDSDGNIIVDNIISKKDGVLVEGLKPGKYILKEVKAAEGYILNDEVINVLIEAGSDTKIIKVVNEHVPVPNTINNKTSRLLVFIFVVVGLIGSLIVTFQIKKS